ncbi:DUF3043 domain-containing protein [uncultured Microbacterium sp.]|uniref:DUF3043 domain-containing protein n=1 Tax=uncultured Microbacterium sp. TaxID=191216 RepID=UPI0025D9FAC4|nr:DUF3043 domain-containing protein [uncultured Microbacterium sp.]
MPSTPPPSTNDSSAEAASGKGHRTPTRAEQEAARRRPLVPDTKEAKAQARADLRARQERQRVGMANGEEKYLPVRDRGPQRRYVRDYVDAGWHLSEWVMALMVVVIIVSLIPNTLVAYWAFIALWAYLAVSVLDMVLLGVRVKRRIDAKFGRDKRERGLAWYAAMRSLQMRFMRLPKPQTKRGQYPE